MIQKLKAYLRRFGANMLNREMMQFFDWPLFIIVICISLFGVVVIFSATSSEVTEYPATVMEMLATQSLTYPRLQLIWIGASIIAMFGVILFDYHTYGDHANWLYIANIAILLLVLGVEKGRGGMSAFFSWGTDRGFQPSEFGKVIMIICVAKAFATRIEPIRRWPEIFPYLIYVGVPIILVIAQPDVGTAMVYIAIFCITVLASGTNWKMIVFVLVGAAVLVVPLWFFLNNVMTDFRLTRILIWLDPEAYPDDARQVINGQIALGSGGLLGKGIVSPGSFASLGYISDDHTDFIFAIVGESFGFVGAAALIFGYILMFARLIQQTFRAKDSLGAYILVGVIAMMLFHVIENLGMVTGLLPVTGIPLPFVSYGGSNMLTNMMAIGLAENVIIRSRMSASNKRITAAHTRRI